MKPSASRANQFTQQFVNDLINNEDVYFSQNTCPKGRGRKGLLQLPSGMWAVADRIDRRLSSQSIASGGDPPGRWKSGLLNPSGPCEWRVDTGVAPFSFNKMRGGYGDVVISYRFTSKRDLSSANIQLKLARVGTRSQFGVTGVLVRETDWISTLPAHRAIDNPLAIEATRINLSDIKNTKGPNEWLKTRHRVWFLKMVDKQGTCPSDTRLSHFDLYTPGTRVQTLHNAPPPLISWIKDSNPLSNDQVKTSCDVGTP